MLLGFAMVIARVRACRFGCVGVWMCDDPMQRRRVSGKLTLALVSHPSGAMR